MKAAAITGPKQAALVDKVRPHAAADFAVVKVMSAPMCTEYKAYAAGQASDRLGHEAAGEVVEVAQPGHVSAGDRVVVMPTYPCGACRYCVDGEYIHCQEGVDALKTSGNEAGTATYAQYLIKQDWLLLPIPDNLSYDQGAMACCGLGPTFGAMELMQVDAFDTILITGLGPVGLGGVINATFRGARVIAVEPHPYRRELGEQLGATAVLDPEDPGLAARIRELAGPYGVDAAVDCTGIPAAQRLLVDTSRPKGHVAFVGEGGPLEINVSPDMIRKGLTLHGPWHYNLAAYPRLLQVIQGAIEKIDRLITHTFPLSSVQEAWDLQLSGRCGKVVLHPWDGAC